MKTTLEAEVKGKKKEPEEDKDKWNDVKRRKVSCLGL